MREKIYFILSMLIFGAVGVFAKYIDLAASEIALFMSLIGSLFLFIICIGTKQNISWQTMKKNAPVLLLSSIALSGNWIFLFQSYKETTIANAALSYYFAPVLVIVLSPIVLKEKLSLKKAICVGTALLGLLLIIQSGGNEGAGHHLLGIVYGLIAAAFYAILTLTNKFIRSMNGLESTLSQLLLSSVWLIPYVLMTEGFELFRISGNSMVLIFDLGGTAYRSRILPVFFRNERAGRPKYRCIKLYRSCGFLIDLRICYRRKNDLRSNAGRCPVTGINGILRSERTEGKPHKVALVACANKLVHWVYAILNSKKTFRTV
ncbi:EamA family transporter [Paenibacillus tyrfis]